MTQVIPGTEVTDPRAADEGDTWNGWTMTTVGWVPTVGWRPSEENARGAYAVLDRIDAEPDSWNQGVYWCGTGGCFAGHRVAMTGEPFDWTSPGASAGLYVMASGETIADRAAQLLGFPDADALDDYTVDVVGGLENDDGERVSLFDAGNTREDLGNFVKQIYGFRPVD